MAGVTEKEKTQQTEQGGKIIRVGLIGIGFMGRRYAQILLEGQVPGMELAAACCHSSRSREWCREHLPESVQLYEDYDRMLSEGGLDAILVVTPHRSHPEQAIKAFEHGLDVMCDKPAAVSVSDARRMKAAAEAHGCVYGIMFHQRMYEKYRYFKQLLDSGELGELQRMKMENSRYYRTKHYHQSGPWRSSWEGEGGAALINQGQHILDIWQWLFGLPKELYANLQFGKHNDFLVEDEATILMQYEGHVTGSFFLTTGEALHEERLRAVCSRGTIELVENRMTIYRHEDIQHYHDTVDKISRDTLQMRKEELVFDDDRPEPYPEMLADFAAAVRSRGKTMADGDAGIGTLELTNGAYLSAKENRPVPLPIRGEAYDGLLKRLESEERAQRLQRSGEF